MNFFSQNVKNIVTKEIKTLAKLYPYNIGQFFDKRMLSAESMLVFMKKGTILSGSFSERLLKLLSGMELVALGLNLHKYSFKNKNSNISEETKYTINLLFGDIFYSCAVNYIIDYEDPNIFESILDSIKLTHLNRLLLQRNLINSIHDGKEVPDEPGQIISINKKSKNTRKYLEDIMENNKTLIAGAGSYLKTAFYLGYGFFSENDDICLPVSIINDFILYKTIRELDMFFSRICNNTVLLKRNYLPDNITASLKKSIKKSISQLRPAWLSDNFNSLAKVYCGPC